MPSRISLTGLTSIPLVQQGDELARLIVDALAHDQIILSDGDMVVVAQKIVSKAEGRAVRLDTVTPTSRAEKIARQTRKDPRLVELVLSESTAVIRQKPGVLIVAHRLGFVMANAGIDHSNVDRTDEVLLLPVDPDVSARRIRQDISTLTGRDVHIIINDSFGRPWRNGTVGTAIGTAGFTPLHNYIGERDIFGRTMQVTQAAVADELAAAASFVMGQGAERTPVVIVQGAALDGDDSGAGTLVRPVAEDLFR